MWFHVTLAHASASQQCLSAAQGPSVGHRITRIPGVQGVCTVNRTPSVYECSFRNRGTAESSSNELAAPTCNFGSSSSTWMCPEHGHTRSRAGAAPDGQEGGSLLAIVEHSPSWSTGHLDDLASGLLRQEHKGTAIFRVTSSPVCACSLEWALSGSHHRKVLPKFLA